MKTLTPEQSARLKVAMTATLRGGSHYHGDRFDITRCEVCARELACWVMTGEAIDKTPDGASELLAALPTLNDGPWRDNDNRTSVILPYLPRLLTLDPAGDERKAYALADYAVRVCAAEVLDTAGLHDHAAALRALAPITDKATAKAAFAAADAAAKASCVCTYAAYVATRAAANASCTCTYAANAKIKAKTSAAYSASAANSAAYAARAVRAAADADATIERHTRAILDIICGQMEGDA